MAAQLYYKRPAERLSAATEGGLSPKFPSWPRRLIRSCPRCSIKFLFDCHKKGKHKSINTSNKYKIKINLLFNVSKGYVANKTDHFSCMFQLNYPDGENIFMMFWLIDKSLELMHTKNKYRRKTLCFAITVLAWCYKVSTCLCTRLLRHTILWRSQCTFNNHSYHASKLKFVVIYT